MGVLSGAQYSEHRVACRPRSKRPWEIVKISLAHPQGRILTTTFLEATSIAVCPSSTPPRSSRDLTDGRRVPKGCRARLRHRAPPRLLPHLGRHARFTDYMPRPALLVLRAQSKSPSATDSCSTLRSVTFSRCISAGGATRLILWSFAGEDVSEGDGAAYRFDCAPEDEVELSKFSLKKHDIQHCIATSYLAVAARLSPSVNQNIALCNTKS
ncbi:hypothetical protein IW261DRAFT_1446188 [Armillaria novae-zelandiae]|uniref:Uncharacterized protein n=1 Tax=Armillaria novae-zelandiae TaxID=153914 RepID=A0AA39PP82_9AGAR|nr:hypothetical protein IW261DRAFT_1446188 [Armillaria novae-zelandiae]